MVFFTALKDDSTFTIASQPIFETLDDRTLSPYTDNGRGTDDSATGKWKIKYVLDQAGFNTSGWMFNNEYMSTNHFEAIID